MPPASANAETKDRVRRFGVRASEVGMMVELSDPIYTVRHVAALCHCSVRTARQLVRRCGFPPNLGLSGRQYLFDSQAVMLWWREQRGELRPAGAVTPRVKSALLPASYQVVTKPYARRPRRTSAA